MEVIHKRETILQILNEVEEELQKNPETIPEHVFQTLEGFCKLIYSWKHSNGGENGWTKPLGYFSAEESKILENRFSDFNQSGGGPEEDSDFKNLFGQFQKLVGDIGTQWKEISSSLGIIATNTIQNAIKKIPAEYKSLDGIRSDTLVQKKASSDIFLFFSTVVESLRLWVAIAEIDSTTYRIFLSLSQAILDTIRGNIRQAIFSSIGLFGKGGYYISVVTHFLVSIIEFVSPDLRLQMEFDIYKNIKTLSASGLLWTYYTFAPETLKYNINSVFQEVQKIAKEEDISLESITKEIEGAAKETHLDLLSFPLKNIWKVNAIGSFCGMPFE